MKPNIIMIILLSSAAFGATAHPQEDVMEFEVDDFEEEELPTSSPAIGDDVVSLKTIYKDDRAFEKKLAIERHLGLYLVRFPQRDIEERINISGKDVTANVWVTIGSKSEDELACKALKWIVFGRTRWSMGARGVFGDYKKLRKVTVNFINIQNRDQTAKSKKKIRRVINLMSVSLTRRDFGKINPDILLEQVEAGQCVTSAREHLSSYKFNSKYHQQYLEDR